MAGFRPYADPKRPPALAKRLVHNSFSPSRRTLTRGSHFQTGNGSLHEFLQRKKSWKSAQESVYAGRSTRLRCGPDPGATFVVQRAANEVGACGFASGKEVFRRRGDKCV